jgi:ABC-type transporter Mla subunit MlaD
MPFWTDSPRCDTVYRDEDKIPLGMAYWKSRQACEQEDYSQVYFGNYIPGEAPNPGEGTLGEAVYTEIKQIIGELVTGVTGNRQQILHTILTDVDFVSHQISAQWDAMNTHTRMLSDQIERSRVSLDRSISHVTNDVNTHTDIVVGTLSNKIDNNQRNIMAKLDAIDSNIQNFGDVIAQSISQAIGPLGQAFTDAIHELSQTLDSRLAEMEERIDKTLQNMEAHVTQALEHTAEAIDRNTGMLKDIRDILDTDLRELSDTIRIGLKDHAEILDKAIRESSAGIATAITTGDTAEVVAIGALTVAIEAAAVTISGAIEAAQVQNNLMQAPKIAKDLEIAALILPIITAVAGLFTLNNPDMVAGVMSEIVDLYFNLGKAVTDKQEQG